MDMMSVKPEPPLDLERSNRPGNEPNIVAGLHLNPLSGVAGINSPHQVPSAARKLPTGPKVRNTVVAPLTLTLTPFGLTAIVCAIAAGANKMMKQRFVPIFRMICSQMPESKEGKSKPKVERLQSSQIIQTEYGIACAGI